MKQPKAPDPYKQAGAQQKAELGASQASSTLNNPNIYTPYGSQTYQNAGYETTYDAKGRPQYVPRYNQIQTLSPDQQKLLGLQTQTQFNLGQTGVESSSKLRDLMGKSIDTSGWQGWGDIRQDKGSTDRAAIEAAMLGRFNTDQARQNATNQAQLAARGMSAGSGQYGRVQETADRARTDATQQAYLASGQEARQAQDAYNQASAMMGQQRGQQSQEAFALRNQPINEIMALLQGGQVSMPQFSPYSAQGIGAAQPAAYMGQNYANALNATNQFNSGLFNLGSAVTGGIARSDRRLKENIHRLAGRTWAGLPLYWFTYRGEPKVLRMGVMADEVKPIFPEAVLKVDGYDWVDYGLLAEKHREMRV